MISFIFLRRLLMLICTKWRPLFSKTIHWSLFYSWKLLISPGLRFISPESNSSNRKKVLLFLYLSLEKPSRFSYWFKQTMLAKSQVLIESYVKNSEVVMLFRVFSEDELRQSFEEKWQMLQSKKIVKIRTFNFKSILCGSKINNKTKLHTSKFSQLLLLLISLSPIWKISLVETVTSLKKITDLIK